MSTSSDAGAEPAWTRAIELERLRVDGRATVKVGARQLALFLHDGTVHACNNRCPHEGYPLVEGALDAGSCVLTCHWHNWKFDLRTGANHYGGDSLRIYPVKVDDAGMVWIDARDAPAEARVQQALAQLDEAMADHDAPRIARELARLDRAGARPELAVAHAIERSHERLRYGMTHAWAGAEVWLRLRDTLADPDERLACAAEALSHIAYDTLREPAFPFAPPQPLARWQAPAFLAAVEVQDEAGAASLLLGALGQGLRFADLEPALAAAALWPAGLLQMALFAGRNTPWLAADDPAMPAMPALRRWAVADAPAFDSQCTARVLDHGLAQYIFPVHLLKTWVAVRDEIALGVADDTAQALRAAVNRLFGARFKQRHLLRTARQAAAFVARED